jgi:hypothetical protein
MRSSARLVLPALVLALGAASCATAAPTISGDSLAPTTTLLRIGPTTSAPPTTPMPTAYPTIPMVTAVAPYWAPVGWSDAQVKSFLDLADAGLTSLGADHSVNPSTGIATLENGTQVDLTLLAARLTLVPTSSWQSTIAAYLTEALSPNGADSTLTWEVAQPLLRVRVGTLASLGLSVDEGVVQPIAGDLVVAVCVELATAVSTVPPSQLEVWGKSADEVMALAIDQTLARPTTTQPDGPFTTVTNDQFASSRVLNPSTVMGDLPANGFVVAIPSIDQFIAIRVDSRLTVATINALAQQAADDFTNRNNPASPDLYWWRTGAVEPIPLQGDSVNIPADLAALLAG